MAEVFRRQQLPVIQMFSDAGLSVQSLAHQHTRYPQDGVTRLWDAAQSLSGNDVIGLAVGRQVSVTGFPVLGYSLITAKGLVDGFQRFLRYQRMIGESANIQLSVAESGPRLEFDFSGDALPVSPHTIDAAMAALVNMARLLEGEHWHPAQVLLSREPPQNPEAFTAFFKCPVTFRQSQNALVLDPDLSSQAAVLLRNNTDPLWQATVSESGKPTAELVAMLIAAQLQDGVMSKAAVATQLNITPRTLQRRLYNEGETYQRVVDRVRHDKAKEGLANPLLLPIEVAFLCGFSDLTAFHHAFKRWQGQTPGAYRASILKQ